MSNVTLVGKVALVTGAGSATGLGNAIASAMATAGAEDVLCDIDIDVATSNAIAPGFILTGIATKALDANQEAELDRTISATAPVRRSGVPEDVANAALFLASVEASYVTGEVIDVNGGIYFD